MSRIALATGAAVVGAGLALAQPAQATPEEDHFLNDLVYSLTRPLQPSDEDGIVGNGRTVCYLLDRGYDTSYVVRSVQAAPQDRELIADPIGFSLVATRSFCPQYSYLFSGL
jgi:hypothetical protein